jgi:hypothetical protein
MKKVDKEIEVECGCDCCLLKCNTCKIKQECSVGFNIVNDTFYWVCDKCGDVYERSSYSVSDIPCGKCDGTYRLNMESL